MNRRSFLRGSAIAGLAGLAGPGCRLGPDDRPNVVYMITDDQRWDLMSCAGHPVLETPHMDRIAHEGARFLNAFVVSSLCSPTRASFLSGLYAHQHGILSNQAVRIRRFYRRVETFPQKLKGAGYQTAYIGKFHIGRNADPRADFDHWMVLPWQGLYIDPRYNINGEEVYFEGWVDDLTGDAASEWIAGADPDRPFCLCVGFKSPHAQQVPPPRYRALYHDVTLEKPASFDEDHLANGKPNVVAESLLRLDTFFDGPKRKGGDWERWVKDFYRCLVGVDDNVGKILAALDAKGVADNTIVVFVGDNGFFLGEHGLADKRFPYEEALRVPILLRYPRAVPAGQTPSQMALSLDVGPTILGFCGVEPPAASEGVDLAPVLLATPESPAPIGRRSFVYEYDDPNFNSDQQGFAFPHILALRTATHKYIDHMQSVADRDELYDLRVDPGEMQNRIDDPDQAETLAALRAELDDWKRQTGWRPPIPVTAWRQLAPIPTADPEALSNVEAPAGEWTELSAAPGRSIALRSPGEPGVTYLALRLRCLDPACGAVLYLGCDAGFIASLNGKRIATREAPGQFVPRQASFDLPLKEGENELLIKIALTRRVTRVLATVQTVGWRGLDRDLVEVG